jgi:hypothetical protein
MAYSTRFRFRTLPRFVEGAVGDVWHRGSNGNLVRVARPADYAAQRAAGTPYRLSIDDATGLPYWEAVATTSDEAPGFAWLYMTTVDGTGATVLMTDADGQPITTYAPVP